MWQVATIVDSTALEEGDGRLESIFDPLAARGILRLSGERRRCHVPFFTACSPKWWRRRNWVLACLSPGKGAWTGWQKECSPIHWTSPWLVPSCSHWLRLCLHRPPTDLSRNSGSKMGIVETWFHNSHTVPLLTLCIVQLTLGNVQRGAQSTCWRIGHFRGGGNYWGR